MREGKLALRYGRVDATLEHWHYDTFDAVANTGTLTRFPTTFALGADGKVKSVEVSGIGTFNRVPERANR
jgi:hypothetical protein